MRATLLWAVSDRSDAEQARATLAARWPEVVTLCSIDPGARAALSDLREAVAAFANRNEWAEWISLILGVLDRAPIVVIEPASELGVSGRMSGVVDNFQLQTLLMGAFPEPSGTAASGRERISRSALTVAQGEGPQQSDEIVTGVWNLYTYAALRAGELPGPDDPSERDTWIEGEGLPADIPVLDGHRVILLGELGEERSWSSTRTFPQLKASLELEALEPERLEAWLARITAAAES